ncbi:flagellar filament capping protein FliD [Clostridium beijerinckii]|uniref:Flagellar hook-associated protein 2 n=1 Tax=Clostridium beijerinckii TaxID=1520 RepID=A0A7X9XMK0_CLOBE|nr:flagellar filament capping protein FliD [Clostridium beijerinckii]NMF03258.1 flagellar filament capping protein FliD [Clostridium beijerinckii]
MTSIMQSSSTNSSSTSSKNLLRISGMASGIDTDSVVKSMVSNYQAKIDKANQAKQLLQWKQDAYRDIIKGVKGLQEYFNPTSDKYILGSNSMNINTATSDITSIASATATSSATAGTYVVTATSLAEQAKVTGKSLDSMIDVTSVTNWANVNLKVGNKTIDLSNSSVASTATPSTVVASINSQIAAASASDTSLSGVSASYVSDGTNSYIKFTKSSTNTSSVNLAATNSGNDIVLNSSVNSGISSSTKLSTLGITQDISFKVNGTTIPLTYKSTSTVQDLMDAVKSATSGTVAMSIDDTTGSISFQSKNYGSTSSVTLVDDTNTTLNKLNIYKSSDSAAQIASKLTDTGADAIVKITAPGQSAVTTTQSSNQFTINGMNYNLVNKGTTNITVTANSDKVVTNIKNFIKDYNTIISTINTKLTEKKNNDYPPLTDAQKESMSEDQIKAWETKAQVGILRNDDYLSNLMSQLRGVFSSPVYSSYTSGDPTKNSKVALSFGKYGNAVGIDTSKDVTDGGLLVVADENKLTNAIKNNLEDFKKLFVGATDNQELSADKSYIGSDNYMEDGLLKRMDNILRQYVAAPGLGQDGKYTLSGSMNIFVNKQYDYSSSGYSSKNTLSDQVYKQTLIVSKLNTQMSDAENRYYKQFSALESAMNSLNSQQSALTSMFSAG